MKKRASRPFWQKQQFVLNLDLFASRVVVAINLSEKEIARKCPKPALLGDLVREISGWDDRQRTRDQGYAVHVHGWFFVLLAPEKGHFPDAVACIAHEMLHVTQDVLRRCGIPSTKDTEEVYAYLMEYLVAETMRRISQ